MARRWNPSHHPRDARGRFTKSSTRVMKATDTNRVRAVLGKLKPRPSGTRADALGYLETLRGGKPIPDAVAEYLAGGWKTLNPAMRSSKPDPDAVAKAAAIDAAMVALPDDVQLTRDIPLKMFAHIPMDELEGMKVRDAAWASTSLKSSDQPAPAAGTVRLHMVAPAGTRAYVNAPDGEVLLARDTEVAISRVEADGAGGWNVYGVAIPTTAPAGDRDTPPAGEPPADTTPAAGRLAAGTRAPSADDEQQTPAAGDDTAAGPVSPLGEDLDQPAPVAADPRAALLDALLAMPPVDAPTVLATAPAAPAVDVPENLANLSDEQLAEVFRQVSDGDTLDELAAARIVDEWDRRESVMQATLAEVPDDLSALTDDDAMSLFARVTAATGTLDNDVVRRLDADLERRNAEYQAAMADRDAKAALVARDPATYAGDDELAAAAAAAADLDDEAAVERIFAEWQRREDEQTRQAAEQADRDRAEAEAVAAQATARAAADNTTVHQDAREAGLDVLADILGDEYEDVDLALDAGQLADDADAQDSARFRADSAVTDEDEEAATLARMIEFERMSDHEVKSAYINDWFSTGDRKLRAIEANKEWQRREALKLRQAQVAEDARARRRLLTAPVEQLTDDELDRFPAMLDALPAGARRDRVRQARGALVLAEATARQARRDAAANRRAAGPAGPARVENPVAAYRQTQRWLTSAYSPRSQAALGRWEEAKRTVLGLPVTASDADVVKAERADPRPLPDRAALTLAWHRHLAQVDDPDGAGVDTDPTISGFRDDPDLPDTVDPLPPANVAKPAEVWKAMERQAAADRAAGDWSGADRYYRARARAYRIPYDPGLSGPDLQNTIGGRVSAASTSDPRTDAQKAAAFIAEWRRLADEDGVDPADTVRAGPVDRGGPKPGRGRNGVRAISFEQQRRISYLIGQGWDVRAAHAEVLGLADTDLAQDEANAAATAGGGGSSAAAIREAYHEWVNLQYLAAEQATRGNMLNRAGKAKREADLAKALFSGPTSTATKYASEELLRWWADNPRMTLAEYRAQLTGGARQARQRSLAAAAGRNEFA